MSPLVALLVRRRLNLHGMFAEQITDEYYIRTEGRGRTLD